MFLKIKNLFVFHLYTKIFFRNHINLLQFSRSLTKRKFLCCTMPTILTALFIVTRDSVL